MTVVTNTWRQLVRSKLWPVAVLLLAALVAVPFLLAREPQEPAPLAPLPVASEAGDTIAEPVVAKVSTEDRDRRRRVLGVRKDPFEPAPVKKSKTEQEDVTAPKPVEQGPVGGGTEGGGGGGGAPAPEKTYYEAGTIIVRFGEASERASLTEFPITKMGPVPDETLPLLVYMGLTKDGKKAKFLVDASVEVDGDGDCKPHKANCEVIELAVGETEFLDLYDTEADEDEPAGEESTEETEEEGEPELLASFQLDLVDIKRAGDADVR